MPAFCWILVFCCFASGLSSQVGSTPTLPLIHIPESVSRPLIIRREPPPYPTDAQRECVQGDVVLQVNVEKDGTVRHVTAISGNGLLRDTAERAVRKWLYYPYLLNGVPVEYETEATVKFRLPKDKCKASA